MEESADIEQTIAEVVAAQHRPGDEWFWCELSLIRTQWTPTRHPFFTRLFAGELRQRELQVLAEEYEHLTVVIAGLTRAAESKSSGLLRDVLSRRAAEAEVDIELWHLFARATGWCPGSGSYHAADPFKATLECARIWTGPERSLASDLVTLCALDGLEPELALLQLNALTRLYGFVDGRDTEYFRRRVHADGEPEAVARAALQGALGAADRLALLAQVRVVYESYWTMLDTLSTGDER